MTAPDVGVGSRSRCWNAEAKRLFPGGVSSPVRAFRGVGGEPPVIRRAKGAYLYDVDRRRYVDLVGSWGPMILGHGHPEVLAAVQRRIRRGVSTGTPSPDEVRLARLVTKALPSVERVRFVVSGTEACMSALRLARAATGRDRVIKFEGCYHGHADAFLSSAGSGALTFGTPDSPGVPAEVARATITVPYNDLEATRRALHENRGAVAAIFVEPVAGNMGLVPPVPGFLDGLRLLADEHGALLVFDEVMTGFRVHPGGAQALYGIRPDLTCFGKVIGGGFPVGAYGGRADLMARISPEGPVYQAGTLAGNPVAMTAGAATLRALLRPGVFEKIADSTRRLAEGLEREGAAAESLAAPHVGTMLGLWFSPRVPRNLAEAKATDTARFRRYHAAMLEGGVHLPPSPFEAWFVSLAHTPEVTDAVLAAHRVALTEELSAVTPAMTDSKSVETVLASPALHWVGDGFQVSSVFSPDSVGERLSPFILLDYGGPTQFGPAAERRGVGEHPHRGFETVTVAFQGEIEHRDSAGNSGRIGPGDVQWMTAAAGVLHEEKHSQEFTEKGGVMEMAQLWVNLPAKHKRSPPRYQTLVRDAIPLVTLPEGAGTVRLVAGAFERTPGAAKTFTPVIVWDAKLRKGAEVRFPVPDGYTAAVFVRSGSLWVGGTHSAGPRQLAVLTRSGQDALVQAETDAEILVLGGEPIQEPVFAYGPFVMNTSDEVREAIRDFQSGRFGRLS